MPYPGDFPPTSSKISSQSASRSMQTLAALRRSKCIDDMHNLFDLSRNAYSVVFWKTCEKQVEVVREM